MIATQTPTSIPDPTAGGVSLQSLFDMVMDGGPIMVPIALCSVVALAYATERSLRLRAGRLGTPRLGGRVVEAARERGADGALEVCAANRSAMARVLAAGLGRNGHSWLEREKAVEDAGAREVMRLGASLRPLVVVARIAPLLGLLGTVWGMIQAFSNIALKDGLGRPELLAQGISTALITTAAGLAIAIPTHAVYYWFRGRIDRFVQGTEDTYAQLVAILDGGELREAA